MDPIVRRWFVWGLVLVACVIALDGWVARAEPITGKTIRGRVYDEATGAGIAAATISFRDTNTGPFEQNWRTRPVATSANDGTFVLNGVPAGRITLQVNSPDYAQQEQDIVVGGLETASLEIPLWTGGTISGRLTAADGVTPVAGSAGLANLDEGFSMTRGTSGTGEFSFAHLNPGRYRLLGQAPGGIAERELSLERNQRFDAIVLALGAGHRISGVVSGLRPEDMKRVRIQVRRSGDVAGMYGDVPVDKEGAYDYRGIQPGRVQVIADVATRRQLSKDLEMPADGDVTVNFNFPPGARLTGHVTRGGTALQGVSVMPRPTVAQAEFRYSAHTSKSGQYTLNDLAEGEYRLLVEGYVSRPVRVKGDTEFDVELPPGDLAGRVLNEANGATLSGAEVELWPGESSPSRSRLHGASNFAGKFVLAPMEAGEFVLTVYKPGFRLARKQITYDPTVSALTISLAPEPGVEVSVHESGSGRALREIIAVEMLPTHSGSMLQIQLSKDGVGSLPAALAGSGFTFSAIGYEPFVIQRWDGHALDLRLTREGTR